MNFKIILSTFCILLVTTIHAQKIETDKDGLIKVEGKRAFYLIKKNATILGNSDFLFKDLEKNDIAMITVGQIPFNSYNGGMMLQGQFRYNMGINSNNNYYLVTFMKSGNQAVIYNFTSLSLQKSFARTLYNAELFKNGELDIYKERLFCLSTGGRLLSPDYAITNNSIVQNSQNGDVQYAYDPVAPKKGDVINTNDAASNANNLLLNQGKIYYKKLFKGTHSKIIESNTENNAKQYSVNFFDSNNLPTYNATFISGQTDWIIYDNNKKQIAQILYDAQNPLADLIENLINNNYIK